VLASAAAPDGGGVTGGPLRDSVSAKDDVDFTPLGAGADGFSVVCEATDDVVLEAGLMSPHRHLSPASCVDFEGEAPLTRIQSRIRCAVVTPSLPLGRLAAAVIAGALASLFATGDAALTALTEPRLQALKGGTGRTALIFQRYAKERGRVLSRWLVARVLAISVTTALISEVPTVDPPFAGWGVVMAAAVAVVTYGVFTEVLGVVARRRPEEVSALALRYLRPFEWAVWPIAEPLAFLGRLVDARVPQQSKADPERTETEVEWVVREGERHGALANEPAEMIRNVLDFKDLVVKDVMVPRRHVTGIPVGASLKEIIAVVSNEGHSRYPVYRETLDNVVGLLYVKDLFRVVERGQLATAKLDDLIRRHTLFAVETQSAASILREMRSRSQHMAVVSDEFGGTSGVVTLEDVLEQIVGDIKDEYDAEAEALVQKHGDGRFTADAAVSIDELSSHIGRQLPVDDAFESLGGLLVHRMGRVPLVGAVLQLAGLKFTVRDADETHVVRVDIEVLEAPRVSQPEA
jgi:putative hemolysin